MMNVRLIGTESNSHNFSSFIFVFMPCDTHIDIYAHTTQSQHAFFLLLCVCDFARFMKTEDKISGTAAAAAALCVK